MARAEHMPWLRGRRARDRFQYALLHARLAEPAFELAPVKIMLGGELLDENGHVRIGCDGRGVQVAGLREQRCPPCQSCQREARE